MGRCRASDGSCRDSPDAAPTGVHSSSFPDSPKSKRELRADYRHPGRPEGWSGYQSGDFPWRWAEPLPSVALECLSIERLPLALVAAAAVIPRSAAKYPGKFAVKRRPRRCGRRRCARSQCPIRPQRCAARGSSHEKEGMPDCRNDSNAAWRMSALGQKRTSSGGSNYVRFWGLSGHPMSAFGVRTVLASPNVRFRG